MFSKKKDEYPEYEKSEPAVSTSPDVRRRKTSVIGPTLKFKGELSANEDLIIEGEIEGTIAHQEKNLTVGKEGRVKADIDARTVEVYGKVEGDIRGEDIVKLAKSADVKGNIRCARIVMEDGARFSGSIDMGQKAKSAGKPTALPVADAAKQAESAGEGPVIPPDTVPEEPLRETEAQRGEEDSRRPLPSIIGSTVVMKGELTVGEDLEIEGTFDGTIIARGQDTVTVRRTARLSGEVSASIVRVEDGTNLEKTVLSGRIRLAK